MKKVLLLGLLLAAAPLAQADNFKIDAEHTYVMFEVIHNGTSTVRGRFDDIDGVIDFDRAARSAAARISIDMNSISTGSDGFNAHLRGADFFQADKYPKASFVTSAFEFDGDNVKNVAGQLELLGQTHPVQLQAVRFNCYHNKRIDKEVCGGDFSATIERSQWGMDFGVPGIPDAVELKIEIEAVRQ